MLERLLNIVGRGGTYTYAVLSDRLGVSEALVRQMVEDLAKTGYLHRVGEECPGRCRGCPEAGGCSVGGPNGIWALTEKGAKVHERSRHRY